MPRENLLAQTLVQLADSLVAEVDVAELLTLLTDRCTDLLEVAGAGLVIVEAEADLRIVASTNPSMGGLEQLETRSHEGPCLDCYRSGGQVVSQDLSTADARWPRFAPAARAAGFGSVQVVPMRLRGSVIGALSLLDTGPGPMPASHVAAAQAFADVATIAILQHRATLATHLVNDQLRGALESRILIEQAKGMLAERNGLDMAAAFELLRQHARAHQLRLVDLARRVVEGEIAALGMGRPQPLT